MAVALDKRRDVEVQPTGLPASASVTTTNATPTALWLYGVNDSSLGVASMTNATTIEIDARIRLHVTDGAGNLTAGGDFHKLALFRVNTGTTASLVGSVQDLKYADLDASLAGARIYYDVAATYIAMYVVGVAATTINWTVFIDVFRKEWAS